VTQAAVEPGMACPLDLTESEQCATQSCVAPGLACSEYSACTDCTDNGKTGPRRCQFCGSADGVGVCQSLNTVDGDASSGLRACAIDFDQRATTIAQCSTPATATPPATPMPVVIETVDVRSALNLGHNETMALVNVTLGDGSRLQVRVKGEEGAVLRALDGEGGIGVWSPSRDGGNSTNATASSYGHVRNGLAIEFLFAKDRPVAFRSLTLGEWDEGDTAQVSIGNDAFASDRRRQEDDTNTVVFVKQSEWTFDEKDTAAGFTKYVLSAVGESSFSIKSFQFTTVRPADSTRSADTTTVAIDNNNGQISESGSGGFQFDTMTIALIAAGGAVCVLLVILLIVCVARRRRRRNGKTGEESSSDSIGKSMDEMRPALGGTEFTLATTSSTEHSMPPPYMPLPAPNRYNDLQIVAPTASESAGVYQALPAQPHTGVSQAYVHVPHLEEHPSSGSPYTTVSSLHNSPAPFPGTAELYRPMPVAQRYDAVSGNEGLVNAIANSGHHLYRAPSANNGQGAAYSSGDLRGV
jgi:hypothetical protein